MNSMIDERRIKDVLELHRLKGLYFFYLDTKNWQIWESLFTNDIKLLVDQQDGSVDVTDGIDAVMGYVQERLAYIPSVHHGHTPIFEFQSKDEAEGIWAMSDIISYSENTILYGYGHYNETYRRENGVWKFSSVHLTRLKVNVIENR